MIVAGGNVHVIVVEVGKAVFGHPHKDVFVRPYSVLRVLPKWSMVLGSSRNTLHSECWLVLHLLVWFVPVILAVVLPTTSSGTRSVSPDTLVSADACL